MGRRAGEDSCAPPHTRPLSRERALGRGVGGWEHRPPLLYKPPPRLGTQWEPLRVCQEQLKAFPVFSDQLDEVAFAIIAYIYQITARHRPRLWRQTGQGQLLEPWGKGLTPGRQVESTSRFSQEARPPDLGPRSDPLPQRPAALVLLPMRPPPPPPPRLTCAGRCLYPPVSPRPPPGDAPP